MLAKFILITLINITQVNVTTGKTQLVVLNRFSQVTVSDNPTNPCLDPPIIGNKMYLEVWVQTNSTGSWLFSTSVDITYDTTIFDTTTQQVKLDSIWRFLPFAGTANDTIGHINNFGGNTPLGNRRPIGIEPEWERLGIITFDVIKTPTNPVIFKSEFAGTLPSGLQLNWALFGQGVLPKENITFGQICIGCSPADMNQDGDVDLKDYAKLMQNFSD